MHTPQLFQQNLCPLPGAQHQRALRKLSVISRTEKQPAQKRHICQSNRQRQAKHVLAHEHEGQQVLQRKQHRAAKQEVSNKGAQRHSKMAFLESRGIDTHGKSHEAKRDCKTGKRGKRTLHVHLQCSGIATKANQHRRIGSRHQDSKLKPRQKQVRDIDVPAEKPNLTHIAVPGR